MSVDADTVRHIARLARIAVADDEVVVHLLGEVRTYHGLDPATTYDLDGVEATTLARPGGGLLAVFATVNDAHFGETECGLVDGTDIGPVLRAEPDEPPYPETMNTAAAAEIGALRDGAGPDVVIAKGDHKLFRARFAGLERDQAEAVCRALKHSDISCMTVHN